MPLSGGGRLANALLANKVKAVFGIPGTHTVPIYRALRELQPAITTITTRHEAGAGYAADGYECDEFLDVLCELGVPRWRYITGGAGVTTTAAVTGAGPSTASDLTGIGPARATEIGDTDADAEGASGLLSLLSRS